HGDNPLGRGQELGDKLDQLAVVVPFDKGRGQHVEITHRQHAPGHIGAGQPAQGDRGETGDAGTDAAEGGVGGAYLGHDLAADAARAVKGDPGGCQPCRLVEKLILKDISIVAVVGRGVVEIVVVKDDAKRLGQVVDVLRQVAQHIRVADQ